MRPLAERLRKDGLKVWFDEWEIANAEGAKRESVSELEPSAFSLQPLLEHGLEHSKFGTRNSEFGIAQPGMSANAFGSDWAQWEAGTFRFRDPLNQERRFIPLRLDHDAYCRKTRQTGLPFPTQPVIRCSHERDHL